VAHEARVFPVKLPDELQIIDRIARPEIDLKPLGEILQQSLPIPSSLSTLLLLLDDLPTDQPVCDDLGCIDRTSDAGAHRLENLANAIVDC
jgi:hypothetical protein